jgi:hypothetical protein
MNSRWLDASGPIPRGDTSEVTPAKNKFRKIYFFGIGCVFGRRDAAKYARCEESVSALANMEVTPLSLSGNGSLKR